MLTPSTRSGMWFRGHWVRRSVQRLCWHFLYIDTYPSSILLGLLMFFISISSVRSRGKLFFHFSLFHFMLFYFNSVIYLSFLFLRLKGLPVKFPFLCKHAVFRLSFLRIILSFGSRFCRWILCLYNPKSSFFFAIVK